MRKLLVTPVMALAVLTISHAGQAHAWKEFRIKAGFDISYKGGGNRFLCGLWESSPGPGCPLPGPQSHCGPASAGYYNDGGYGYGADGYLPPAVGNSGMMLGGGALPAGAVPLGGMALPPSGSGWQAPAPKPELAPAPKPVSDSGYQPVGYFPYGAYYPGYSNPYAAPTYAAPGYYGW